MYKLYTLSIHIYISLKEQLNNSMIRVKIFKSYDAPKFNIFNFLPQLNYSLKNTYIYIYIFIASRHNLYRVSFVKEIYKKKKERKIGHTRSRIVVTW